jgi:drug/metabolite transporter (DMT)-like permease
MTPAERTALDGPLNGILFMLAGSFFMSLNNAILKWLSAGYPAGQVLFMRSSFIFVAIGFFIWRAGGFQSARIGNPKVHLLRASCVVCSAFLFMNAVRLLPLADVIAITFVAPLFLTALATPVLGEHVGVRRWAAVAVGFIGMLIIIRPGGDLWRLAALLPLGTALMDATRDLFTRRMTNARETANGILVTTTAAVGLAGLCTIVAGTWKMPSSEDFALIAVGGLITGCGHYCMVETFRMAEAGLVAPFRYSSILWAGGLGYIFWDDLPDQWVVAGTVILIASGVYILHRELVRRRGG